MMSAIVRFAIRMHGVVFGLGVLVVVYGLYALTHANLDVFPEFSPTQVVIQTESPGLSAELVEVLVTQPIENSLASTVMGIGLTSDTRTLMELRTLVDWTLRPHLLTVPGVADVNVFGGEVRQFQIQVDPNRLIRYNVSLQEVMEAASKATGVRGGGFIENGNQRIVINSEGQSTSAAQLAQLPL